jgi:hypothetical protein
MGKLDNRTALVTGGGLALLPRGFLLCSRKTIAAVSVSKLKSMHILIDNQVVRTGKSPRLFSWG